VEGQRDKLMMVVGHQFITLTVDMRVKQGGIVKAPCRASLSAAAETCFTWNCCVGFRRVTVIRMLTTKLKQHCWGLESCSWCYSLYTLQWYAADRRHAPSDVFHHW